MSDDVLSDLEARVLRFTERPPGDSLSACLRHAVAAAAGRVSRDAAPDAWPSRHRVGVRPGGRESPMAVVGAVVRDHGISGNRVSGRVAETFLQVDAGASATYHARTGAGPGQPALTEAAAGEQSRRAE